MIQGGIMFLNGELLAYYHYSQKYLQGLKTLQITQMELSQVFHEQTLKTLQLWSPAQVYLYGTKSQPSVWSASQ